MKEKKYIHRKVTNQSDFLTQFLYVTGVLLRTRKKQGTWPGQKHHTCQSQPAHSQPQTNRLQIPEAEALGGKILHSQQVVESTLGLWVSVTPTWDCMFLGSSLFTWAVRQNAKTRVIK